jgi:subtilisin family serine protease
VIGTACGPKAPVGNIPRYGIGFKVPIFVGKVFSNSGTSTTAIILAGMNWAIANRCPVITLSVTSQVPAQAAYTAAGAAALARGCVMIAGAGNSASQTGAPANSPTIMAVASLDPNLSPSSFSSFGKIEIAAPGRDIFSSISLPTKYKVMSGTSHAAPHVSGCAALWAQTSPALRAMSLWKRLQLTAKPLPFPPSRVGKGLVQAPWN